MRLPCEPQYILRSKSLNAHSKALNGHSKALNGHSKALNGTFIGYERNFHSL